MKLRLFFLLIAMLLLSGQFPTGVPSGTLLTANDQNGNLITNPVTGNLLTR